MKIITKKMIFLAMSVVCVGQLVGMERPEPETAQELFNAIEHNMNQPGYSFYPYMKGKHPLKIALEWQEFIQNIGNASPQDAYRLTEQLIMAIQEIFDPKARFNFTPDERKNMNQTLEYLNKLRRLFYLNLNRKKRSRALTL